jgi:hypothetical protein
VVRKFRQTVDKNSKSGNGRHTCPFYEELLQFYGDKPSTRPHALANSANPTLTGPCFAPSSQKIITLRVLRALCTSEHILPLLGIVLLCRLHKMSPSFPFLVMEINNDEHFRSTLFSLSYDCRQHTTVYFPYPSLGSHTPRWFFEPLVHFKPHFEAITQRILEDKIIKRTNGLLNDHD